MICPYCGFETDKEPDLTLAGVVQELAIIRHRLETLEAVLSDYEGGFAILDA